MFDMSDIVAVTLVGFAGGVVLGLAARFGRFCSLGAIEDALYGGTNDRILMWPMAIGIAVLATGTLSAIGMVAIEDSLYLRLEFNLVASVAGGLMFGIGMALAGNCGFGALSRVGGGDFRSMLVVVVIGVASYMIAIGPLAEVRLALFPRAELAATGTHSFPDWLSITLGLPQIVVTATTGALLLGIALRNAQFLRNGSAIFWSSAVGLSVAFAWWGTTYVAEHGFEVTAIEAHTFTMPLGEVMLQAMGAQSGLGGFSVGSVLGVITGAYVGAIAKRQFRWEACDDPGELKRQISGGVLMGFGGVIALGCSIGQGLSAFSVLAISAPVTLVSIVVGAIIGLRYLIEGKAAHETILQPLMNLSKTIRRLAGR